jgi:hypothetical protein
MNLTTIWLDKIELAQQVIKQNNSGYIDQLTVINGVSIGRWAAKQRTLYNNGELDTDRIQSLESIGFQWSPHSKVLRVDTWDRNFALLAEFKAEHGHANVPFTHVVTVVNHNGEQEECKLGYWLHRCRAMQLNDQLSETYKLRFNELGTQWQVHESTWFRAYEKLVAYQRSFGTTVVPRNYMADDFPLGKWVADQRVARSNRSLTGERLRLLRKIDFVWNVRERQWRDNYRQAKQFYDINGTKGFAKAVVNGVNIGNWRSRQIVALKEKSLDASKVQKLLNIGIGEPELA